MAELGVISSLVNGMFGTWNNANNRAYDAAQANADRKFQDYERKKNEQFQSWEAEKDRWWQREQWFDQFAAQNSEYNRRFGQENAEYDRRFGSENAEWERRFNLENEYNSPAAQIARMRAAGINPAAAMGQLTGAGGLAAAGGSSSPGMPGVQDPSVSGAAPFASRSFSPVGVQNALHSSGAQMMSSTAQMLDALSKAKEVGLKSEYQRATLDSVVKQMNEDAAYKQSMTNYNNVQTMLESIHGHERLKSQIASQWAAAFKAEQEGDYYKASAILQNSIDDLTKTKKNAIDKILPEYIALVGREQEELRTRSELNEAKKKEASASAGLISEEAVTEKAMRPWKVKIAQYESGIKSTIQRLQDLDYNLVSETQKDRISAQAEEYQRAGLITKELAEKVKLAAKDNDSYTLRLWQNLLKDMVSGGAEVYNARTGRKRLSTGRVISSKTEKFGDDTYSQTNIEPYSLDDLY